jgi:glycosyltransferase involved in cell wall biosynthesis
MRITVVTGFFLPVPPVAGGAMEKIWFRLAREFVAAGHEVSFYSRSWPGFPSEETIDGVRMVRVRGFNHTRRLWTNLLLDFVWGLRVAARLPEADVVACNTVSLPVYLRLMRPRAGRVVAVLGRMPKGHAHFYGRVDRLIATSQAVRDRVVLENPRLAGRTRVFPNPIDWHLHQRYAAKPVGPAPLVIGYVGRLHPEKGIEILLEAAAILARRAGLPRWKLRLVGPQGVAEGGGGEAYVAHLRAMAAGAGAEVVIEAPVFDVELLAAVYGGMHLFCYPSLAEKGEGLSVAPIEAMAAGSVPVVSSLDCYRDVIRDGENGLLFDHRSPERASLLAGCLARLLEDRPLCEALAARAAQDSKAFDYSVVAAAILADFGQGLLSQSNPR